MHYFFRIFFLTLFFLACNTSSKKNTEILNNTFVIHQKAPYDFNSPKEFLLDDELTEISGLGYDSEKDLIYTHNDEKGYIYKIDKSNGEIIEKIKFAKNGDYEGIEKVGDEIVVVANNGDLFFYNLKTGITNKIKTLFSHKNNIEGACFDPQNKLLLLSCKGASLDKKKSNQEKTIYAFNLKTKKLNTSPYINIPIKKILHQIKKEADTFTKPNFKKAKKRIHNFSPSGIAIHPKTKNIYVISARGSLLVVLNKLHKIEDIVFFDQKNIPQPEGICFDNDANLYLSTEGKLGKGKILKYLINGH